MIRAFSGERPSSALPCFLLLVSYGWQKTMSHWYLCREHHLSLTGDCPLGDSGNWTDSLKLLPVHECCCRETWHLQEVMWDISMLEDLGKISCIPISSLPVNKWFSPVFTFYNFDIFLLVKTKTPYVRNPIYVSVSNTFVSIFVGPLKWRTGATVVRRSGGD